MMPKLFMDSPRRRLLSLCLPCVAVAATLISCAGGSGGTSNPPSPAKPTASTAWSENAGWIDGTPAGGGVTVANGRLSGYAWGENLGWIHCQGAVSPASGPYLNTDPGNWGVNVDGGGNLSGYAWSENAGWIHFGDTGGNAKLDLDRKSVV